MSKHGSDPLIRAGRRGMSPRRTEVRRKTRVAQLYLCPDNRPPSLPERGGQGRRGPGPFENDMYLLVPYSDLRVRLSGIGIEGRIGLESRKLVPGVRPGGRALRLPAGLGNVPNPAPPKHAPGIVSGRENRSQCAMRSCPCPGKWFASIPRNELVRTPVRTHRPLSLTLQPL